MQAPAVELIMKTLKELTITARRPLSGEEAAVENMSRVVCALLMRAMRGMVKTPDFWKVSFRINGDDERENNKVLSGVLVTNRPFPSAEFVAWPRTKREDYMLQFVSDALRDVLLSRGIDAAPVEAARRYVSECGFRNLIVGKTRFTRQDGLQKAHIECEQEIDEARIYLVLRDQGGGVRRLMLERCVPEEFVFQIYFGRVEWIEHEAVLIRADGVVVREGRGS